jgi:hypothetical protein
VYHCSMRSGKFLISLFSLCILAACATNKINWSSRIGTYTYDDAILELGVPDRSATLTDGTTVCEWLQYRGQGIGTVHYYPGSRIGTYDVSQFPDSYLRLLFGPDKKLIRSEKFAR